MFLSRIISLCIVSYSQCQSSIITFILITPVQDVRMEDYHISSVENDLSQACKERVKFLGSVYAPTRLNPSVVFSLA